MSEFIRPLIGSPTITPSWFGSMCGCSVDYLKRWQKLIVKSYIVRVWTSWGDVLENYGAPDMTWWGGGERKKTTLWTHCNYYVRTRTYFVRTNEVVVFQRKHFEPRWASNIRLFTIGLNATRMRVPCSSLAKLQSSNQEKKKHWVRVSLSWHLNQVHTHTHTRSAWQFLMTQYVCGRSIWVTLQQLPRQYNIPPSLSTFITASDRQAVSASVMFFFFFLWDGVVLKQNSSGVHVIYLLLLSGEGNI